MPSKSKSIFRQPGAQHFQLVHRSQRDPLINDPDASQHVLKPVVRENAKKGKSRADLEVLLSPSDIASGRSNIGEASLYGVYFDDTEYDYMQHLRPVGGKEEGFEPILAEAPKRRTTSKNTSDLPISLHDIPPEALPSATELPRDFEGQAAIQSSISGLKPDMDPHLRQALEALEDDAFVEDDLSEDFFGELVKDGERDVSDPFEYEFRKDGLPTDDGGDDELHEKDGREEAEWVARFAAFKTEQGRKPAGTTLSDSESEDADTVGQIPEFSAPGSRRRRWDTSDASGFSMSSASILRSEGLRDLDDRFDQIEKQYIEDEGSEDGPPTSDDSDSAPGLITSREDFDSLMDDFLHNYEVAGGKMKPSLPGSGPEKLQSLRLAMGRAECLLVEDSDKEGHEDDDIHAVIEEKGKRERWDVETVLTTYTNLENHPRLIKAREGRRVPKILLDPKSGFPLVEGKSTARSIDSKSSPGKEVAVLRVTTRRPREETPDERRERKRAVKEERQTRRAVKKEKKEQFSAALKQQSQALARKDAQLRKL